MSEYSFFLSNPQAAWISSADHQVEEIRLQTRGKVRKLYFSATPDDQTSKLGIVPNIGSQICISHEDSSGSLGTGTTSFAKIEGKNSPIEQIFEIGVERDFFNDLFAIRDTRLHLHVKCGIASTDAPDFKVEPVVWFRISLLPTSASSTNRFFK
jgi:hypothetical protein